MVIRTIPVRRFMNVQRAPEFTQCTLVKEEFDVLISTKKEAAPGPDGLPYNVCRCVGAFVLKISI